MTKKKNPLYVLTNEGKDVVEADGYWDALLKKLGIEKFWKMFREFLSDFFCGFKAYVGLKVFENWIDDLIGDMKANVGLAAFLLSHIMGMMGASPSKA